MSRTPERIIISRTDSIGDVVLTLPMAGVLRELFPAAKLIFLGRSYTKPIVERSEFIDEFVDWGKVANSNTESKVSFFKELKADIIIHVLPNKQIARISKKAGIHIRIGTTNRGYHWLYCNRLIRLSRKNSSLHESQLNLKLIRNLGAKDTFSLDEIPNLYGFKPAKPADKLNHGLSEHKFNLILHPKSKGSAREWGLERFSELVSILPTDTFQIIVTGTADEGKLMEEFLHLQKNKVVDLTGKLTLDELIDIISAADGLVAASTGPLHIAAAMGIVALGIYPPIVPMHPGRWKPIGKFAGHLVANKKCSDCRSSNVCKCMKEITADEVKRYFQSTLKYKEKFKLKG